MSEVERLKEVIAEQKEQIKQRDGEWWRGYEAALHWISKAITENNTQGE